MPNKKLLWFFVVYNFLVNNTDLFQGAAEVDFKEYLC